MKRFKNILFFADGASRASAALRRAVRLAETNHARLTVIDVLASVETPSEITARFDIDLDVVLQERRLAGLDALIAPFNRDNTLIYTEVLSGIAFVEVIRAIRRRGYDLLIKAASSPEGFSRRLFGSTDQRLLRECPCPVWIDRPSAEPHYSNILAAVDPMASPEESCDRLVMDFAVSLAERESAKLTVVHAWQLYGESMLSRGRFRLPETEIENLLMHTETRHRERLGALLAPYGIDVHDERVKLVKGKPASVIRAVSEGVPVDLIVMGTVGRVGIPGFLMGNTAEEVIQTTEASVLAVKPDGFVSPLVKGEEG